jgi:hypothetical protein
MVGEMWFELVAWAQEYMVNVTPQMANPVDMMIPRCVNTFEEAIALLRESHAQWALQGEP